MLKLTTAFLYVTILCGNEEQTYCLTQTPDKESIVAKSVLQEISVRLQLSQLAEEFDLIGKFMKIAYYSIGHASLQCQVRAAVREVYKLCTDTINMLNTIQISSKEAINCLQAAYQHLEKNSESIAIKMLQTPHKISEKMRKAAEKIQEQCIIQSDILKKVGDEIIKSREEIKQMLNKKLGSYAKFEHKRDGDSYSFVELKEKWNKQQPITDNKNTAKKDTKTQTLTRRNEMIGNGEKESELLHTYTVFFLHKAVDAVNHIEAKIREAENFWKRITSCKCFTGEMTNQHIDMLNAMEPNERHKIWENFQFKNGVLTMYTSWMALEKICADLCRNIESVLPEIREELLANPSSNEAIKYMKGIVKDIPAIDY